MNAIINVVYTCKGKFPRATSSLEFVLVVEIQILSFLRESYFCLNVNRLSSRSNSMEERALGTGMVCYCGA